MNDKSLLAKLNQKQLDCAMGYMILYKHDAHELTIAADEYLSCPYAFGEFNCEEMCDIMSFIKDWATNILK